MQTSRTFAIHFWLQLAKLKDGFAPIFARVTVDKKRIEISLKRKAEVTFWDSNSKRSASKTPQAKALNLYLDQVYADLFDCYKELSRELPIVTAQDIKARFLGEDQQFKSLLDIIEYHKVKMTSSLTWGTLKNYNSTETYLRRFLQEKMNKKDIFLYQLSYSFIVDFEHYLRTTSPINKGQPLSNNGLMKHLERLKKLLNLAVKLEWVEKHPFIRFSLKFTKHDRPFLTQPELEKLEQLELNLDHHQITRDIFIFCCYTGLAYSDVKNLTENHIVRGIDGEYWIFSKRTKSGQLLKIPLLDKAIVILDRYKDPKGTPDRLLLPVYCNQKVNEYLKEIRAISGINKKLTFHSSRHTFATTVTLSNGVPIETVSKLLGHSKLSTTQVYARVLEKKVSEDMSSLRNKLRENIGRATTKRNIN